MHFKVKKHKDKDGKETEYLQLVESYRSIEGKSKHRVLAHLGRKDNPKLQEKIEKMSLKLAELAGIKDLLATGKDITPLWTKSIGPKLVFRKLWEDLYFDEIFAGEYHEHILMMVLNRLCDPQSKLSCMRWKETVHEPLWNNIQLHELYKSLDWLMKKKQMDINFIMKNMDDLLREYNFVHDLGTPGKDPDYGLELLRFG